MAGRKTEAELLRERREQFERAQRDNIPMSVAKARIAAEARAGQLAAVRRIDERIADTGGCRAPSQQPTQRVIRPVDDSDDGLKWFQR